MSLTLDDIRGIAQLARLALTDDELEKLAGDLNHIVAYVDQLGQVNTDAVEPLAHPLDVANVFRDDVPGESLPVDEVLSNAPNRQGDFYSVPAVHD